MLAGELELDVVGVCMDMDSAMMLHWGERWSAARIVV